MSLDKYEILQQIGSGAQGTVSLVQSKEEPSRYFAMKTISKKYIHLHKLLHTVYSERHILAHSKSPWLPKLYYAFQSKESLHLILEMVQGGDMMELLITKDIFPEDVTRFYIGEILLALQSLHLRHIIHRDLKPDNILLDTMGHIKLTDFAMSAHSTDNDQCQAYYSDMVKLKTLYTDRRNSENEPAIVRVPSTRRNARPRLQDVANIHHRRSQTSVPRLQKPTPQKPTIKHKRVFNSLVGTLDYVAPEMFEGKGYTEKCDLWSLGIITFEMLFGHTPFTGPDGSHSQVTMNNILNWKVTLQYPDQPHVSEKAKSFISQLLCEEDKRMNAMDAMNHPFLCELPWTKLRSMNAPFVPKLDDAKDLRYFPLDQVQAHVNQKQQSPIEWFKSKDYQRAESDNIIIDEVLFEDYDYNSFGR